MSVKIFALVTVQGTAMHETALCGECKESTAHREESEFQASLDPEAVKDSWTDCSGNEYLSCVTCGATSTDI